MSYTVWVLGTEPRTSTREVHTLNHWTIYLALCSLFWSLFVFLFYPQFYFSPDSSLVKLYCKIFFRSVPFCLVMYMEDLWLSPQPVKSFIFLMTIFSLTPNDNPLGLVSQLGPIHLLKNILVNYNFGESYLKLPQQFQL